MPDAKSFRGSSFIQESTASCFLHPSIATTSYPEMSIFVTLHRQM